MNSTMQGDYWHEFKVDKCTMQMDTKKDAIKLNNQSSRG